MKNLPTLEQIYNRINAVTNARKHSYFLSVKGKDLMPGMVVRREPDDRMKPEIINAITGACHSGLHFGSGCYDRISTWYIKSEGARVDDKSIL